LDEYQRDEYFIAVILRYISSLVSNVKVKGLKVLIIPICTGTAPTKIQNLNNPDPSHLNMTNYIVYDVYMSPMDMEASLNFMNSVKKFRGKNSNPFLRTNPLYYILIGAVRGIPVIMEQCSMFLMENDVALDSAEQAKEIWRVPC